MSNNDFFSGKRPWSTIKDAILGSYMSPYFAKVSRLPERILIIDAFAGPGTFDDGSAGSPLIICQAAERYAAGRYEAIFVNNEQEHHEKLTEVFQRANFRNAKAILGDSRDVLKQLHMRLDEPLSIFLYLDPFGLKSVSFDLIEPFLNRHFRFSTEILVNLQAPILHRLAAHDAYAEDPNDARIADWHSTLTRTLGGDYWQAFLLNPNLSAREREEGVVNGYRAKLSSTNYLTFTGACPIQQSRAGRAKYYMVFASRHIDAMRLFNDEMLKAFENYMHKQEFEGTLFADTSWKEWRDVSELRQIILDTIAAYPEHTRLQLWGHIVQGHFMRFTESEYKKAVTALNSEDAIHSPTPRKTKRLNDDCILRLGSG